MDVDQEHRFEACLYEDIRTRLTANVIRVYKNLFILRQALFRNLFQAEEHLT